MSNSKKKKSGGDLAMDNLVMGNLVTDNHAMDNLTQEDQEFIRRIDSGELMPPLYSDVIAKRIFNPDVHPERLNFLMRNIARDDTIDVRSSLSNESFKQSLSSKAMILDIPAWLKDNRIADLEMQKAAQAYIFTRAELYSSDLLLLQYSAHAGQAKSGVGYENLDEVLVMIFMTEILKAFK